jgi:hypothetical protein
MSESYRRRERLLFEAEARFPDRPDFAVRFADFFLAGAFLVFFAEAFRLAGVTLRTTSLVVSSIDFCAAPALAARLPNVEPMVSATLISNPLFLSSALLPSVMVRSSVAGLPPKIQTSNKCAPTF